MEGRGEKSGEKGNRLTEIILVVMIYVET